MLSRLYWASKWREVIAADSRKTILLRRDKMLEQHGDSTLTIHTNPDGSTIRKLNGQGDHDYESDMQGNCVRDHSSDDNVHSLRDKDNIPILSFGMDTVKQGECRDCDGSGETYQQRLDDDGYERGGGYETCTSCGGNGKHYGDDFDGRLRLHSVLRKENGAPHPHETIKLLDGLREHFAGPCDDKEGENHHTEFQLEGRTHSWEDYDKAKAKAVDTESKLPRGDVYVRIPEHRFDRDDEGTVKLTGDGYGRGEGVTWHKEDPGESVGHYVIKTPYTPRRFDHDTGLQNHLSYGQEMPDEPSIEVKSRAEFPKNAHSMVHQPRRPTKVYAMTMPSARNNPEYFTPEGLHTGMIEGHCQENEPGNLMHGDNAGLSVKNHDVWEINFDDEDEARKHVSVNQYGHETLSINRHQEEGCGTCGGKGRTPNDLGGTDQCTDCRGNGTVKVDNVIPWSKVKLHRAAQDERLHPLATFHAQDDGSVRAQVVEPEKLHITSKALDERNGGHTWQALHNIENSHLDGDEWATSNGYNDGFKSTKPQHGGSSYEKHEVPMTITVPNDPKYVEPIPQAERRDGNKDRQWRMKKGVTIPKGEYEVEHESDGPLAPTHAYLHVPHTLRDNEKAYTEEGINTGALTGNGESSGYGRTAANQFKITTEPNGAIPGHYKPHHPFSPSQADIFKLDLSKMPDWKLNSTRPDHQYGEGNGAGDQYVTRVLQPQKSVIRKLPCGRECKQMREQGHATIHADSVDGEELDHTKVEIQGRPGEGTHSVTTQPSKVIPWEAVESLHNKAEVQPTDEYAKRFGSIARLQSTAWGEVRSRKVST